MNLFRAVLLSTKRQWAFLTKVSIDEWLFSFAKLHFCEEKTLNKFINDYENRINMSGTFTDKIKSDMMKAAENGAV